MCGRKRTRLCEQLGLLYFTDADALVSVLAPEWRIRFVREQAVMQNTSVILVCLQQTYVTKLQIITI